MPKFEIFKGNSQKLLKNFRHDNVFLVFFILFAIVLGIFIAGCIAFYTNQQNSNVIQSGVYIKEINVSVLTKEEAIEVVQKELSYQEDLTLHWPIAISTMVLSTTQQGCRYIVVMANGMM